MHCGLQIYKIPREINHLIYMDDIKLCKKDEKRKDTGDPDISNENIRPGYWNWV